MANDMNQCNFTGRLGQDPDVRSTPTGVMVANFDIAVGGRKKQGDQWVETTEWVPVVVWGKVAEIVEKYIRKGSQVRISGRFQTRSWEQDGQKRYKSEIVANEMQMLGSRQENQNGGGRSAPERQKPASAPATGDGFSDDIPF